jgi:nicotinate dehydrogenase subunit A
VTGEIHQLTVNGVTHSVATAAATPLLAVLREQLGLVASRFGCGAEACGACMVSVDGRAVHACTLPVDAVGGRAVLTAEAIGRPEHPHPLQRAFLDEQAGQCGYCLSGILISAKTLLDANPKPTRTEIVAMLDRHLCRCGAHNRIIRAVEKAAAQMRKAAVA